MSIEYKNRVIYWGGIDNTVVPKMKEDIKNLTQAEKIQKRLRAQVLNALPGVMRDSIRRKEKEDKKITATYKLNQLKAKYID